MSSSASSIRPRQPSAEDLSNAAAKLEENADFLVTSNDSEIIRQTLRLYGSLYVAIFLLFCFARKRFNKYFNLRSWVPELKSRLAVTQSYGFFSWAWQVFRVNDDELMINCGMDAVCFLRCLRLGTKLSAVGCFNAIWLIPTFYTARGLAEIEEDKFVLMSVANLNPGSNRFAAVVVAFYITVILSLFLLSKEYDWYIKYKHKYLSLRRSRNFAVYVSGIPESLRSDYALADFFQRNKWKSTVLEANVAMNIPKLEAKVAKRDAILQKLEHAMAEEKLKGKIKKHRTFKIQNATHDITSISQTVESVQVYRKELDELNKTISLEIGKVRNSNHRLRRHLTKEKSDADILRGRTLTPSTDEIHNSLMDASNYGLDNSDSTPAAIAEDEETGHWQTSFRWSGARSSRLLETNSIISEEMPEEHVYTPEVDLNVLSPIQSNESAENEDGEIEGVKEVSSISRTSWDFDEEKKDENFLEGNEENKCSTCDIVRDHEETQATPATETHASSERSEMHNADAHPFLQLVGLSDLQQEIGVNGGSTELEIQGILTEHISDDRVNDEENNSISRNDSKDEEDLDEDNNERKSNRDRGDNIPLGLVADIEQGYSGQEFGGGQGENPVATYEDHMLDEGVQTTIHSLQDTPKKVPRSVAHGLSDSKIVSPRQLPTKYTSASSTSSLLSTGSGQRQRSSLTYLSGSIVNSVGIETVAGGVKKARDLSLNGSKKVVDLGVKGSKTVRDLGVKGSKTVRDSTVKATHGAKKAAELGLKKAHQQIAENAASLAPMLRVVGEGSPRTAGFVVFKDHYTTQAALQMLQHPSPTKMLVEEAPTPNEVYWRNVGLPDKARRNGSLLATAATATLCLFWSFPVAFISSLTEVNSLKAKLPGLEAVIEKVPALEMFMALMAPLLLLALNECILPVILKWFAQWEGHISSPRLEASLFRKLSAFAIIQTFFVSTVSGSLTSELANMIDNPEEIVEFLANSLPTQSSYFIQLLFVFTFLIQGLELLRMTPLCYAFVRRFVGPNLTEKERRMKWTFIYSLEDPPDFWHAETFAQIVLFYVVFFVYATISPITCVFLFGCFLILESGYRYNFIHNYPTSPDSGGRIWAGFIVLMYASIFIGQLTLIGLLIINEAFYSVPALVPLVVITILFLINVHPKKMHVAGNLPAFECLQLDKHNEEGAEPSNYDFLRNQYLQPALKKSIVFPDESSFHSTRSFSGQAASIVKET